MLNYRQELFAQHYALTANGRRSALIAGYSPTSADAQASDLLKNAKVAARIHQIRSRHLQQLKRRVTARQVRLLSEAMRSVQSTPHARRAIRLLRRLGMMK